MNYFLRSAAYIFHPLLMPLIGARLYFGLTPRFIEPQVINAKTYAIIIIKMVFSSYQSPEMYYFFVGVLFTTISALVLVLFNFKVSLHQMGVAGVTMFLIALSVHFNKNYLLEIGIFFLINGWVASSRLDTKSHTILELLTGFFIGLIPQIVMLNYWL